MDNEKDKKGEMEYGTLDHMKARTQARINEAIMRKNPLPRKKEEQDKKEK